MDNTNTPQVIIDKTVVEQPVADYGSSTMFEPANITDSGSNTSTLTGGTIGSQGPIFLGSDKFRMDGKEQRLLVNDGAFNRVLIGKRVDGTYGIDVSFPGFDALVGTGGELALSSGDPNDWTPLIPSNFSPTGAPYSLGHGFLSVANYVPSKYFVRGTLVRLKQANNPNYQYYNITDIYDALKKIRVTAGDDYPLTMDAVTEFSYSNKIMAPGFPMPFNFSSTLTASGAMTLTTLPNNVFCTFFVVGGIVFTSGSFGTTVGGVGDTFITQSTPFFCGASANFLPLPAVLQNAGAYELGGYWVDDVDVFQINFQRFPTANWGAGIAKGRFDICYPYAYGGQP